MGKVLSATDEMIKSWACLATNSDDISFRNGPICNGSSNRSSAQAPPCYGIFNCSDGSNLRRHIFADDLGLQIAVLCPLAIFY